VPRDTDKVIEAKASSVRSCRTQCTGWSSRREPRARAGLRQDAQVSASAFYPGDTVKLEISPYDTTGGASCTGRSSSRSQRLPVLSAPTTPMRTAALSFPSTADEPPVALRAYGRALREILRVLVEEFGPREVLRRPLGPALVPGPRLCVGFDWQARGSPPRRPAL